MVITKEINQKIVIAAILVSFFLIIGSIYLHIRQKHHLGRLNIGDDRVQPTNGVENLSKDDVIYIYLPPLQQTPSESVITQPHIIDDITDGDYVDATSKEYVNDATPTMNSDANVETLKEAGGDSKSTESYIMDNEYNRNTSIEYAYPSSDENAGASVEDKLGLTQDCLRCLCKTVNDCKPVTCSLIDPCGIYGISKYYWIDGGQQTTAETENDYSEEDDEYIDYLRCVNNDKCATDTVKSYLKRYQRDCNNDGIVDCQDHIMVHVLGPTGCQSKPLSTIHKFRMNSCLQ